MILPVYFDTSGWTGGTIAVTYDGDTNTWAYDTEIGSVNGTNLYNFAENFKTWANHADRDWHPGLTFTYSLSVGEYGVNERIRMTASASDVTWVANATMQIGRAHV